ncbi:hypothetical protein [Roseovarius sp. C03]|uniref:hypothetical protein n=1 Tax=Roseovarius sp. C03 TaxID=3449222 RepID=UPI003EDC99FF
MIALKKRDQLRCDRQLASDDFFYSASEPANPLAELKAEGLQEPPDFVLQLGPNADQRLARRCSYAATWNFVAALITSR